jgi:hypothetical protein
LPSRAQKKGIHMHIPRTLLLVLVAAFMLTAHAATAQTFVYVASLSGPNEDPPNNSPGTGFTTITFDLTAHTLRVQVNFSGLQGTVTAAHFHAPTANPFTGTVGIAIGLTGFPTGVTAGSYDVTFNTLNAATWNTNYMNTFGGGTAAGAEAAFAQHLAEGRTYLNIHSNLFPGGEIRGFMVVPEPGTVGLFVAGGVALLIAARRKGST